MAKMAPPNTAAMTHIKMPVIPEKIITLPIFGRMRVIPRPISARIRDAEAI